MDERTPSPGFDWYEEDSLIAACRKCPRLVEWREAVAQEKRKSYADWTYWGRAVPHFGDPSARRLIIGLAPAAHGANRTGRLFTGDRSGDWLFRALFKAGFANQAEATSVDDGLELTGVIISAICHCAPPDNKPLPLEIEACSPYLIRLLNSRKWKSILCLGGMAWEQTLRHLRSSGLVSWQGAKPKFGHGTTIPFGPDGLLVGCFHPSQQNTFTGRLTEEMLDSAIRIFGNL